MSKLSSWLHAHANLPQVNLIPQAEQLAKVTANEVLNEYRAAIIAGLNAAEQSGDTLIDTGDAALKTLVDSHLAKIPGLPQSILVLVENFVEVFDTTKVEGDAKTKYNALIDDVKQKISQAHF